MEQFALEFDRAPERRIFTVSELNAAIRAVLDAEFSDIWVSGEISGVKLATSGHFKEALDIYRWYTPLLHLDTHVKLVQYIKLAMAERGMGAETVRAPRLPIAGEEREAILNIIRRAIETRPNGG